MTARTVRAMFVGGPLDGRLEPAHRRPMSGEVKAVEPSDPAWRAEDDRPTAAELEARHVVYRSAKLVDLDGTTILVYAPEDAWVDGPRGPRPPVSLWDLARARRDLLGDLADEERALEASARMLRKAERRVDELAGELERARVDETFAAAARRSSGDA